MTDWKELISLNPDDENKVFFKKLSFIPQHKLPAEIAKFERYAKFLPLLKFHRAILRRPEMNVRLMYNDKYGFHSSSCLMSIPDLDEQACTCEKAIENPKKFLLQIETDFRFRNELFKEYFGKGKRCKICKHYKVEFELVPSVVSSSDRGLRGEK